MKLILPPQGTLTPNNEYDPLPYYYRRLTGGLYQKRLQMGLDLLPRGARTVLEVGVGSGILIPTLSAHFSDYVGSDLVLADGLERLVQPTCHAEFIRADLLQESSLPAGAFDAVICLSVLEHIRDADAAAFALACTLTKGGTLVTGYPMVNRLMSTVFRTIGFANIEEHHVSAPATIAAALAKVLRPLGRRAFPPHVPVPLALYQCTSWIKE
jgi:2-polyprenyl-3-methyl-5-hydroxy-6-metoxy-1,4-benzoquinol methylase